MSSRVLQLNSIGLHSKPDLQVNPKYCISVVLSKFELACLSLVTHTCNYMVTLFLPKKTLFLCQYYCLSTLSKP